MLPFNWLPDRLREVRLASPPSAAGIAPLNAFSSKVRRVRPVRVPTAAGMLPASPLALRSSSVTCPPPQVTPNQLHGVVVASQSVLSSQATPPVSLYSVTKAWHSAAGMPVTVLQSKSAGANRAASRLRAGGAARAAWPAPSRSVAITMTAPMTIKRTACEHHGTRPASGRATCASGWACWFIGGLHWRKQAAARCDRQDGSQNDFWGSHALPRW